MYPSVPVCIRLYPSVSVCIRLYSSVSDRIWLNMAEFAWICLDLPFSVVPLNGKSRQIQANLDKFRQIHQQAGCYSRVQAETGGKFEKKNSENFKFLSVSVCIHQYPSVSVCIPLYTSLSAWICLNLPGFAWICHSV